MQVFGASHVGNKRSNNEDSLLINRELNLYAVADGVGGQPKGEVASYIATYLLEDIFKKHIHEAEALRKEVFDSGTSLRCLKGVEILKTHLCRTLSVINQSVLQAAKDLPGAKGMASTLSSLWFFDRYVFVMHTGDSRIYRLRRHQVKRLTHDQSHNSRLIGALGFSDTVKVEVYEDLRYKGDCYLLCSDGVTTHIQDHELLFLMRDSTPAKVVTRIVNLALARGGVDNITAIAIFDDYDHGGMVVAYGGPFYREPSSPTRTTWYPPPAKDKGPF